MCLRSPHKESNFLAETRFFAGAPDSFAGFFTKTLAYVQNLLYLCSGFQSENGRNCDKIRNISTLWIYKETSM